MRRKWLLLTLSCLSVLLGAASRAEACTCGGPGVTRIRAGSVHS